MKYRRLLGIIMATSRSDHASDFVQNSRMRLETIVATLLLLMVGCSDGEVERMAVSGKVTIDGQVVETGSITFTSMENGNGQAVGQVIENGRYKILRQAGATPGHYRVEIFGYRKTGRQVPDMDLPGQMTDEAVQFLPPQFNRRSELRVEILNSGNDDLNFELKSR